MLTSRCCESFGTKDEVDQNRDRLELYDEVHTEAIDVEIHDYVAVWLEWYQKVD